MATSTEHPWEPVLRRWRDEFRPIEPSSARQDQAKWGCTCLCRYCFIEVPIPYHTPPEGFTPMSNLDLRSAEQRIANAERELVRARQALESAQRNSIPDEPSSAYITFWLMHDGRRYSYAAIRVDDRWYVAGSGCPARGYTWQRLVEWMRKADATGAIMTLRHDGSSFSVTA